MYEVELIKKSWWQVVWEYPNKNRRAADLPPYTFKQNAARRAKQLNDMLFGSCQVCGEPAVTSTSEEPRVPLCTICWLKLMKG